MIYKSGYRVYSIVLRDYFEISTQRNYRDKIFLSVGGRINQNSVVLSDIEIRDTGEQTQIPSLCSTC